MQSLAAAVPLRGAAAAAVMSLLAAKAGAIAAKKTVELPWDLPCGIGEVLLQHFWQVSRVAGVCLLSLSVHWCGHRFVVYAVIVGLWVVLQRVVDFWGRTKIVSDGATAKSEPTRKRCLCLSLSL